MDLLNAESLPEVLAHCFLNEARHGHLWVPLDVGERYAYALASTVRWLQVTRGMTVHIDTDNGTASVWRLAGELEKVEGTRAEIGLRCKSAGLIIACACKYRVCQPNTEFLFHGSPYKCGLVDDRKKAQWFAERTTASEEFWWDLASSGRDYAFGAEKALELGVVQEVASG